MMAFTMRILQASTFLSIFATVAAAPAIVWSNAEYGASNFIHSSEAITSESLLADLRLDETNNSSLSSVIFLIGRTKDGAESLSLLASQNALPNVASKQDSAQRVYHHVSGIQTASSLKAEAKRVFRAAATVSLEEFVERLDVLDTKTDVEVSDEGIIHATKSQQTASSRRTLELDGADLLIVNIGSSTDPKLIDAAVIRAVDSASISTVVLSAIRSVEEVKLDREILSRRRLEMKQKEKSARRPSGSKSRRRLDEVQDAEAENVNEDYSGEYYVSLTPNILAGLLFFFLFITITYIGVGCMGMISGGDVFATKMPGVGRES